MGIGLVALLMGGVGSLLRDQGAQRAEALTASTATTTSSMEQGTPSTLDGTTLATSTVPPTDAVETTTTASVTTITPTTTSAATTPTTAVAPETAIAAFIEEFGSAIAAEDVGWLFDHLHTAMILGYGEDVCRSFITNEILLLGQYTLTGAITGPASKTLVTNVGEVIVEAIFEAEISFVFQGRTIDATAEFVLEDEVTWLAICR